MDFSPLVSIVIPVYNGSNYLREAIESAIDQTYKNIEIIIVNDGSCDNGKTRNIALSYGGRIKYYEKENGGVSSALNLGIKNMTGEYFSWLSHDDLYAPRKIQASIDLLSKSDDKTLSVLCNSDFLVMPEGCIKENPKSYKEDFYRYGIYYFLCDLGAPLGCSLLIHRSYFKKYGLFDVTKRTTQDYYQWFKFYKNNTLLFVKEPLVHIRLHPEQGTHTEPSMAKEVSDLYSYIADNVSQKNLDVIGLSLYQFYSLLITKLFDVKYKYAIDYIISKMRKLDCNKESYKDYSNFFRLHYGIKRVILYCAGKRLRKVYLALYMRGISVDAFSDSNMDLLKNKKFNLTALHPDDLNKENDLIIITKWCPDDVKLLLQQKGFKNVYTYDQDIYKLICEIPIKKEFLDEYEKWL